ncbi:hypothetical protein CUJ83_08365 [Methanocella sp. CWC-04]|uniref:Uncharacterized protein n=1 Tax=Methanooceanicella nereidis TaxID=2052831 RepID=A0AAP2RCG3_9EURY|nr:hypothetical protein [Methanocella sp. CWC-04]MCD1295009.1 hypothetical protein [Methanocella sp. CWC-04]
MIEISLIDCIYTASFLTCAIGLSMSHFAPSEYNCDKVRNAIEGSMNSHDEPSQTCVERFCTGVVRAMQKITLR